MGVNTNIYFMYGWEVKVTKEFKGYMEEVDYELPKGVIATNMSYNTVYLGAVLDESGDLRRGGPCFGDTFWSEERAMWEIDRLGDSLHELDKYFSHFMSEEPRFAVVQVHS
jgi:hypothetical protein